MTLKDLFKGGVIRKYPKGQIILYQGDSLENYYYIKQGFLKIYTLSNEGEEHILLLMGRNESFPILNHSLNEPHQLKYFYEAMTDIKLQVVSRSVFNKRVLGSAEAAVCLLQYVVDTSSRLMQRLNITESKKAEHKISGLLPFLARKFSRPQTNGYTKLPIKLTHQDIASMTGLTRETTSIQMKQLERDGVIKQQRSGIRVNVKKLNKLVE